MKIIIAGSRNFHDYDVVEKVINDAISGITEPVQIVCGCCVGADLLGERYAKEHGLPVKYFPAEWGTYGRSAGPRRNRQMAEYAKGDGMLIAFWNGRSKGTKSMIEYAKINNLPIIIHKLER